MKEMTRLRWFIPGIFGQVLCLWAQSAEAGVSYADPAGGWTYIYDGVGDADGGGDPTSLDGTWDHNNGSDQWDGTGFFEGNPGGVFALIDDDDTTFLRMEDTGDPRDNGASEPSNRKYFFGHDITAEGASDTVLDEGVTLTFRARVPLNDGGFSDGYPAGGNGYVNHDGGKSTFTIKQNDGGTISFFLALDDEDQSDFEGGGLGMNSLDADAVSGTVDWQGTEGERNLLPLDNLSDWHEFWINIFAPGGTPGTHLAAIYADGAMEPQVFNITAGSGSDYDGFGYLAMGLGSTPQTGAVDVDFYGWAPGIVEPEGDIPIVDGDFDDNGLFDTADMDSLSQQIVAGTNDTAFDLTGDGAVDVADQDQWRQDAATENGFGAPYLPGDANLDGTVTPADLNAVGVNWQKAADTWSAGDFDGDGFVGVNDLNALGLNWQGSIPIAAAAGAAAVPEPGSALLLLLATTLLLIRRRR